MKKVWLATGVTLVFISGFAYGHEYARRKAVTELNDVVEDVQDILSESEEKPESKKSPEGDSDKPKRPRNTPYHAMTRNYSNADKVRAEMSEEEEVRSFSERREVDLNELHNPEEHGEPHRIEKSLLNTLTLPVYEVFYFSEEDVVADEYGQIVPDHIALLGQSPDLMGMGLISIDTPVWIRNPEKGCVYELRMLDMTYQEFAKERMNERRNA